MTGKERSRIMNERWRELSDKKREGSERADKLETELDEKRRAMQEENEERLAKLKRRNEDEIEDMEREIEGARVGSRTSSAS